MTVFFTDCKFRSCHFSEKNKRFEYETVCDIALLLTIVYPNAKRKQGPSSRSALFCNITQRTLVIP
jgi:hypothetical protein